MAEPAAISETTTNPNIFNLAEHRKAVLTTDAVLRQQADEYGWRLMRTPPIKQQEISDLSVRAYSCRLPTLVDLKDSDNRITADAKLLMRLNSLGQMAAGYHSEKQVPKNLKTAIAELQQVLGLSESRSPGEIALDFLDQQITQAQLVAKDDKAESLTPEEKTAIKTGKVNVFALAGSSEDQRGVFLNNLFAKSTDPAEVSALKKIAQGPVINRINQALWGTPDLESFRFKINADWNNFKDNLGPGTLEKIAGFPAKIVAIPGFVSNNKLLTLMFLSQLLTMVISSAAKETQPS